VIGGYVPGAHGLDSIVVGYYRGKELVYVARVRNGFVPASRRQVFEKLRPLASGITQNRPVRVTSKPDNGEGSGH
jgi:bifunctional non-homologous end joining protein LigD